MNPAPTTWGARALEGRHLCCAHPRPSPSPYPCPDGLTTARAPYDSGTETDTVTETGSRTRLQEKWTGWTAYVDTITTGVFFVGMWLMAKRKIENWIYWIVGDVISVPLYLYKGLAFTSLQYLIFTVIAIYGYLSWKKILSSEQ